MQSNIINTFLGLYNSEIVTIYETRNGYYWQVEYADRTSRNGYNTVMEPIDQDDAEKLIIRFNEMKS